MIMRRGGRGLGEILYESAEIAFDTVRGMFFNPITKQDYGTKPPPGGWEISWYGTPDGQVIVPVGDGGVAKTAEQAAALKAQVSAELVARAATDSVNYGAYAANTETKAAAGIVPTQTATAATQTTATTTTATTSTTSSPNIISSFKLPAVPAWFKEEMVTGIPNWMLAAAAAVGGYLMTKEQ